MSFLAEFIMRGKIQAILVAFLLALIMLIMHPLFKPFIIIASFATIALVTLRKGGLEGIYTLFSATVLTATVSALLIGQYEFLWFMLLSCLAMWIPIWLVAIVLRESRLLSLAIDCAVFIIIFSVVVFYLYTKDPALLWREAFEPLLQMLPKEAPVDGMRTWINDTSHYMTGTFAASFLFAMLFGLFLARWWQSVLYNPGGFRQEFLSLRTGTRLAIVTIIIVIIATLASGRLAEMALNVAILLFVLYVFVGTSVLHTVFSDMKQRNFLVPLFYVTMILIPHAMLPVAIIGLCDAWLNLRKILSTPSIY